MKGKRRGIILLVLATLLGEGILGWGLYWPILLVLDRWDGVFWLAALVGIFIAVLNGQMVGLPSLLIIVFLGLLALVPAGLRDNVVVFALVSVILNLVTDKILGLSWTVWEMLGVALFSVLVTKIFDKWEGVHVRL